MNIISVTDITKTYTERKLFEKASFYLQEREKVGVIGINGTGNANCSYLMRFPFQEVKMDRDMTLAYFNNETARIVIENEIRTMQKLGIPMVVEGVEKLEQSEEMERLGVEYIQGYYYGKPLPEMECLRYIRNFNSAPEDYGR